jgi:hypothetical protein
VTEPLRRFGVVLCNDVSRFILGERWATEDDVLRFYGEGRLLAEFDWAGVYGVIDMAAQVGKIPELIADDARPKRSRIIKD